MSEIDLLRKPLDTLMLTEEFRKQCERMGFRTLEDILVLEPSALLGRAGFSYRWLAELTEFLADRGLFHLLQTIPGRTSG